MQGEVDVLAATRQESGRAGLVYTVMLGAPFDIFCSPACLKESCLKTIPH